LSAVKRTVLVAGATGVVGRGVARLLHEAGSRVKTLSRDPARARGLAGIADEIATGDATLPASLRGMLDDVDAVASCLGAPPKLGGSERRSFRAVDTVANLNLLEEARRADVRRFVYVAVHPQPGYDQTAYVRAHEEVVEGLRASGISHGVVRPTGLFPSFDPFLAMARRGIAWLPGDGRAITNPVHPLDVAEACLEALSLSDNTVFSVGGPDILTREEIVWLAFDAFGKRPRVFHIPAGTLLGIARAGRPFHRRFAEIVEFAARVFTSECVAPRRGNRRLAEHFRQLAAKDSPKRAPM
jgi:uncharacterized protein YbjT (DUF2867 family)